MNSRSTSAENHGSSRAAGQIITDRRSSSAEDDWNPGNKRAACNPRSISADDNGISGSAQQRMIRTYGTGQQSIMSLRSNSAEDNGT
jgi:hypothetical protein